MIDLENICPKISLVLYLENPYNYSSYAVASNNILDRLFVYKSYNNLDQDFVRLRNSRLVTLMIKVSSLYSLNNF